MDNIYQHTVTLKCGRHVSLFVNKDTGLICVDVVRHDERGGNEILRINAHDVKLPTTAELDKAAASQHDEESE